MESMRAHFERDSESEGAWTGYNASLSRPLLNTAKFLEKKPVATPTPSPEGAEGSGNDTPTLPGLDLPEVKKDPVAAVATPEKAF
jgi:hypothetical protein